MVRRIRKRNFKKKARRGNMIMTRRQGNPLSSKIPNTMKKYPIKVQCYYDVTIAGGLSGIIDPQVIASLNYPGKGITYDGATASTFGAIGISSNLRNYFFVSSPFDEYRVVSLEMTYIPEYVTVSTNTVGYASPDPQIMYIFRDNDDSQVVASPADQHFMNCGCKPLSTVTARQLTAKFTQLREKKKFWLNTGFWNIIQPTNNVTFAGVPFPDPMSSLKLCWPTQAANAQSYIGRIYLTWNVIFRGINSLY